MAHAGTMVGGSAQTKQSGRPWPAIALTLAVVVAMIGAVWFATSAGLAGGTAKPVADRSYDQIEAQRGAFAPTGDRSLAFDQYLNGILDGAHATPYVGAVVLSSHAKRALDRYLNGILDGAHATPYAGETVSLPFSATSGTFHPGRPADHVTAPATRDQVGGP
jgi:hypothetical protein